MNSELMRLGKYHRIKPKCMFTAPPYAWCQQELRKHLLRKKPKWKERTDSDEHKATQTGQRTAKATRAGASSSWLYPHPPINWVTQSAMWQVWSRKDPGRVCPLGTLIWDPRRLFIFLLICLMSIWLLDQVENLQGQKECFSAFSRAKFYYHTEGILGKDFAFLSQKPVKAISLLAALPPAPWEVSSLSHCHRVKNSAGLSPGFAGCPGPLESPKW